MTAPAPEAGFDGCAARYDELRPIDANWWQLFDRMVELGDVPLDKLPVPERGDVLYDVSKILCTL